MPTPTYGGPGPGSSAAAAEQQQKDMSTFFPTRTGPAPRVDPTNISTLPGAYSDENGKAYGTDAADYIAGVNKNKEAVTAKNNADTTVRYTQGLVDGINAKYAGILDRQKTANAAVDARAYALNSSRGLKDSGSGVAALNEEEAKGKTALDRDDALKQSEISAALGKSESLRANLDKMAQSQVEKDEKTYNDTVAKTKKDSLDILTGFGKGGISLQTLKEKEPDTYKNLKKSLGYSDLELEAKYNSVKTNPIKYQYKIHGDTVTAYGVDANGQLSVQEEKVPGLATGQWEIKETKDGDLYKINKADGTISLLHAHSTSPGTDKPTTYSKNEEYDAKLWIAQQKGFDEDVDYKKLEEDPTFKAWAVQQAREAKAAEKKTGSGANPFK